MHNVRWIVALAVLVWTMPLGATKGSDEPSRTTVSVECTRASGLVQVNILNHRKIGNVLLEVRDASGDLVYVEEGKAMSHELVRRFDKGIFPKGEATLNVQARDFNISRSFVVQ